MSILNWFYRCLVLFSLVIAGTIATADPNVSALKIAFDAAWQRSPQARAIEARRHEAVAGQEAAKSWAAGSPIVGLAQHSDRWNANNGRRETEVSISTPVWLPGQKAARQILAQATTEDVEAQIAVTQLALAGEVRERIWGVAASREALVDAQDHLKHIEAFVDEVMRRVKAGDLARTDGMAGTARSAGRSRCCRHCKSTC